MPKGLSLLETLWAELDRLTAELLNEAFVSPISKRRGARQYWSLVGEARGVAWCIATIENPYTTDVDAIRLRAMERYNESHA
jgi:hypothetical protein